MIPRPAKHQRKPHASGQNVGNARAKNEGISQEFMKDDCLKA
jgi:hypothetical protein